jgi:hypothetical protein
MENIISDAVNHFRTNKQNMAYRKSQSSKTAPKPFPGITLQSSENKIFFSAPFQSAAALAPPMYSTPIAFSSSIGNNVPIVETQDYVQQVEKENIETDVMEANKTKEASESEDDGDEDGDQSEGGQDDESDDEGQEVPVESD